MVLIVSSGEATASCFDIHYDVDGASMPSTLILQVLKEELSRVSGVGLKGIA